MITRKNIDEIYTKYSKLPKSTDDLDMGLLFDSASEYHGVYIDPDTNELIISSVEPDSPFHAIPVSKIHAIIPFEEWIAIVLHSSIIFLNRQLSKVAVDIKPISLGFQDRMRNIFRREA